MNNVQIKYSELANAMTMGKNILASVQCEDCGSPKSMNYGGTRRCFKCWEANIVPKKKTKKKDRVRM
jgi:uncharacterized Zn finger protein (UPF0148 family)